ncbi:MAG TPA: hypothetical protein VHE56_02785 [Mycobacteriales bacterium]|nr:hypothetical protein [Mycobacteriales bacterium]
MRATSSAIGLAALLALAGCGGSSSGGGPSTSPTAAATAPADQAAATAAIKTTWTTFFHSGADPTAAAALLENGDQLAGAIRVATKLQHQQKIKEDAEVVSVVFTSPTAATVTYNLLSHGQSLLPNATGTAVLVGGQWKVSQQTFCTLVLLGAGSKKVPGCS